MWVVLRRILCNMRMVGFEYLLYVEVTYSKALHICWSLLAMKNLWIFLFVETTISKFLRINFSSFCAVGFMQLVSEYLLIHYIPLWILNLCWDNKSPWWSLPLKQQTKLETLKLSVIQWTCVRCLYFHWNHPDSYTMSMLKVWLILCWFCTWMMNWDVLCSEWIWPTWNLCRNLDFPL